MKNFLVSICFLFISINSFSQRYINILNIPKDLPIIESKVTYQEIIEIPGASMAELYGFAKKFIAESYTSTDAAIDMDDTLNGVIVVKGRADVPITWFEQRGSSLETVVRSASTKHVLIFEMKDNKLRYTLKDILLDAQTSYSLLYQVTDFNIPIEYHIERRQSYKPNEKYKRSEMGQFNFSGAFVSGCHEYFTGFISRFEPYFKNQKAEDW